MGRETSVKPRRFTLRQLMLVTAAIGVILALFTEGPELASGLASQTYLNSNGEMRSYLHDSEFYVAPDGTIVEPGYLRLQRYRSLAIGTMLLVLACLWYRSASSVASSPTTPVTREAAYRKVERELIRKVALVFIVSVIGAILLSSISRVVDQ